jgi:hypothetical protein
MLGYLLPDGELPCARLRHRSSRRRLAPALAYQIGSSAIRVMFDLPNDLSGPNVRTLATDPARCSGAPRRRARRRGPATGTGRDEPRSAGARDDGRVVLVGDAAGCCHRTDRDRPQRCARATPCPARRARVTGGDLSAALGRYAAEREGPQRTRLALAQSSTRSSRAHAGPAFRDGILRYWTSSAPWARRRWPCSTQEGNMTVMAREYARVVGYALADPPPRHCTRLS